MDIKIAETIVYQKLLDDIDNFLEYRKISVYQGINGCIEYIQQLTGCDRDIAEQIIKNHEELTPSNETPQQYEARTMAANAVAQEWQNKPKCPTCGSQNIEKISLTKKAFGGAMFGLFSSNVRNTMHCKNCGYKW